jgi:hypothetical protein
MKKKCRVYKKTGNTPKRLQYGGYGTPGYGVPDVRPQDIPVDTSAGIDWAAKLRNLPAQGMSDFRPYHNNVELAGPDPIFYDAPTRIKQKGGPAMTQDSQPDPVYEQRNANFLNFLKTTSQDVVAKQQLDQQKEMPIGYAEDGQEQKDGTYIPEYLDKGNITRPGAKMNDYGYLDNSNMNAFIGDYQNSRPDWGGSFFGLLGAANKTKKNMFKMELEDGQTQQNFFKDPTDIDYDQTTLDKLDFTGYKKAGRRGKDRVLSYTAEGTSKYIPGQRQKALDASKGILDVARKEGDLNPTPGSQDGGQPSPEEMAMMQEQQAQAPQQPQEQQTDEIIGQVQQALEGGAQPQEVMMQLLQSGMPPESVAQVFIQLGMPEEQVVQAIEQVMAQGQEQAQGPQGPQPSEEDMMAMQQQQQMGAPAPPMMQTGVGDSEMAYGGQLQKAQDAGQYGFPSLPGFNDNDNNDYQHGYGFTSGAQKGPPGDEQVTEDGEIYLKKQGRFKQAWNDNANFGQNANNLMQMATNIGNLGENKQKKLDAEERMSNVHRRFGVDGPNPGDYASNAFGFGDNFKMNQKTRMSYDIAPIGQDGMQVNDEMELTEEQINQLISQGYQLEYLD